MRNHKQCSICERGGAKVVNALLENGVIMKTIAAQTGFSKSSVHRHSQKCVIRAQAAQLKAARYDPLRHRIYIQWPGQSPARWSGDPKNFQHDPSGDVLLVVTFEKPLVYEPENSPSELKLPSVEVQSNENKPSE